eukprot:7379155-Prymnesium_polylepis.1
MSSSHTAHLGDHVTGPAACRGAHLKHRRAEGFGQFDRRVGHVGLVEEREHLLGRECELSAERGTHLRVELNAWLVVAVVGAEGEENEVRLPRECDRRVCKVVQDLSLPVLRPRLALRAEDTRRVNEDQARPELKVLEHQPVDFGLRDAVGNKEWRQVVRHRVCAVILRVGQAVGDERELIRRRRNSDLQQLLALHRFLAQDRVDQGALSGGVAAHDEHHRRLAQLLRRWWDRVAELMRRHKL